MTSLTSRLVAILTSLRHAVAAFAARESRAQTTTWIGALAFVQAPQSPTPRPLPVATWHLLWHRLNRLSARLNALFHRWQTGTMLPRRTRPLTPRPTTTRKPQPRLPRARGWINARIHEAAPCTGTLALVFQDPELPRFLAEAPQAGRLLRPLAHALGVPLPPCLSLPPRPPPPRPLRPRPPRPQKPPPPPLAHPLPANIRAAARAWKKLDT